MEYYQQKTHKLQREVADIDNEKRDIQLANPASWINNHISCTKILRGQLERRPVLSKTILASERSYRQIITLTNRHAIVTQNIVGGADMEIHIR